MTSGQEKQVRELLQDYSNVLTDLPGKTNLVEHDIKLTSEVPVRSKPYPVPHSLSETIKKEVDAMMRMGIIEESDSPYASPVVMVKKADGSNRFCTDFSQIK